MKTFFRTTATDQAWTRRGAEVKCLAGERTRCCVHSGFENLQELNDA
jgi:hypothetical protein